MVTVSRIRGTRNCHMTEQDIHDYRNWLFPIAYNMLSNAEDAEDMVQETILKWLSKDRSEVENVRGYLVRSLINKCLNFIRDRKTARSHQPFIAPELVADHLPKYVEDAPSLSLAMLAMLEKLNPTERAVFMLKEVFSYSHKEIAEMLGLSEENCRQILTRARRHMKNDKARFEADPDHHLTLYKTFIEVCQGENLNQLLEILREDIQIHIARPAATLAGRQAVARFLLGQMRPGFRYEMLWLKKMPVLVAFLYHQPIRVLRLEGDAHTGEISRIDWREAQPSKTPV